MKAGLIVLALCLAPSAALAQFAPPGAGYMPFGYGESGAGAAAAIDTASQAIQQCTQHMRGRSVETVCTTQKPDPGKKP